MARPLIGLLALLLVASACARPQTPRGGPVPETPLQVTSTIPEHLSVVEPFGGPVRIRFQRQLSERLTTGSLRDVVVVSPRTGPVEVERGGRGIEISMEGGFRDETVYRITVLPRIQDLFQNSLERPFDLVFSTGPELEPNVLAGIVTDRLTLAEVAGARIDAAPVQGGPKQTAVTDSTGFFAFPFLPSGEYAVVAYEDLSRDREPDFQDPQDSLRVTLNRGDTLIVTELALLPPDTTAAVLTEATVLDSLHLRATFDDHLDPEEPLDEARAFLTAEDGPEVAVLEVLHLHEWEARREEERRRAQEEEPEPPDPDAPPEPDPDPPEEPDPDPDPELVEDPADDPPLPARDVVLVLGDPVSPAVRYRLEIQGIRNINGIPDGGGELEIQGPGSP